ncbi:MAG TPA: Dabb family protein [Blastocatellia bacterium]|nr:Dabb family protein [Blastocatellia bacterium]
MIKHVVFANFKPETTDEQRRGIIKDLEGLPGQIDVIRDLSVGLNVVESKRAWDFALVVSFDDLPALDLYANHPAHVPVKEKVAAVCREVGSVDFEC